MADDESAGSGSARRGANFEPKQTKAFVSLIETLKDEKDLLKATHKEEFLDPLDEDVAAVYDEAERVGVPKNILRAAVKKRKLERDADKIRDKFEGGTLNDYDAILLALGELA